MGVYVSTVIQSKGKKMKLIGSFLALAGAFGVSAKILLELTSNGNELKSFDEKPRDMYVKLYSGNHLLNKDEIDTKMKWLYRTGRSGTISKWYDIFPSKTPSLKLEVWDIYGENGDELLCSKELNLNDYWIELEDSGYSEISICGKFSINLHDEVW